MIALRILSVLIPVFALQAQLPRFQNAIRNSDGTVSLSVQGRADRFHRVDRSPDLFHWVPAALLGNTNAPKVFREPMVPGETRFYRVVETERALEVTGFEPEFALPGEEVRLQGQFFEFSGRDTVMFGGAAAELKAHSQVELVVTVPEGAESGPVRVESALGKAASRRLFSVVATVPATVLPPAGLETGWLMVNPFGWAITNGAARRLIVPLERPVLNSALDNETNRVLYAVSLGTNAVTFSVESTARALVFLSPVVTTPDPLAAARVLGIIETNREVAELAAALTPRFSLPEDPFADEAVIALYHAAVRAVLAGVPAPAAVPAVGAKSKWRAFQQAAPVGDYPIDLEFTGVYPDDEDGKPLPALARRFDKAAPPRRLIEAPGLSVYYPLLNPVDWLVEIREIDADAAFPEGRVDFDRVWRQKKPLEAFPLRADGFRESAGVEANLIGERFNFPKYFFGELLDYIGKSIFPEDEFKIFPDRDGLHLVRAIGPSLWPGDEKEFANAIYPEERTRIIAANLMAAVMDSLSVLIDVEALKFSGFKEILAKVMLEAAKIAPTLTGPEDAKTAAGDLFKAFLGELADKGRELLIEAREKAITAEAEKLVSKRAAVVASRAASERVAEKLSRLNAALKVLDIAGGIAQVAQRLYGFAGTSPMETAFVMIGDPFKLDLSIAPGIAAPGEEVVLNFGSAGLRRMFAGGTSGDSVSFESFQAFDGAVLEVGGTPQAQSVRVQIPGELTAFQDGQYQVIVNSQGRRGRTNFTLSSVPRIADVTPRAGFAAVDDFLGSPFPGSPLRVRGAVFNGSDDFFIGSAKVTDRSGGSGNVQVRIPKGAADGPVIVERRDLSGKPLRAEGPAIAVWGAPIVDSFAPARGTIGTPVIVRARETGTDPNLIRLQFAGLEPQTIAVSGSGLLGTIVPAGATSGPVRLITPGGVATVAFTVEGGIPFTNRIGGIINVGGGSLVTLGRAADFAAGQASPLDDSDFERDPDSGQTTKILDPPNEEGDYLTDNHDAKDVPRFPFGFAWSDSINISGTVAGDVDFRGRQDSVNGGAISGRVVISGDNQSFSQVTFKGEVTITGRSNFLNCTFEGPVVVRGTANVLRGAVLGGMVLEGDGNIVDRPTFRNTPGHALLVKGDWNRIDGIFDTNSGDGIRIDGGRFNKVEVNRSRGNRGNGVTLTGGAAHNEVNFQSGIADGSAVRPGSGNEGHGIALLGEAAENLIFVNSQGSSGNKLDGAYLDGPGVALNRFVPFVARHNGRNGMTLTNGCANNFIGVADIDGVSSSVVFETNAANGLAVYGAKFTSAAVNAALNGGHGVLLSAVQDPPSGTMVVLQTGTSGGGNRGTGLRLEKGTTGVRANLTRANRDGIGLELDGEETQANTIETRIGESAGDGIVLRGARRNEIKVRVEKCGGTGVALFGASRNILRVYDANGNRGDGIRIAGGGGNQIVSGSGAPFPGSIARNQNGIVVGQGSGNNRFNLLQCVANRACGIVVEGAGTSGNSFFETDSLQNEIDGLVFRDRASGNTFGVGVDNPFAAVRSISFQDNKAAGVRFTGEGTMDNSLAGAFIAPLGGSQAAGVIVENFASQVRLTHLTCSGNGDGLIVRDSAGDVTVLKSIFASNTNHGVLVAQASVIAFGTGEPAAANQVYSNRAGIRLTGGAARDVRLQNNFIYGNSAGIELGAGANRNIVGPNNQIDGNVNGIVGDGAVENVIAGNRISGQIRAGIELLNGSRDQSITGNSIARNFVGISVNGPLSLRNSILNNSITGNETKGIELVNGANNGIRPPDFAELQADAVLGESGAPEGSRVQIFQDGEDEGETLTGGAQVVRGHFRGGFDAPRSEVGILFNLTGTVTDPDGNTSEFKGGFPDPEGEPGRLVWTGQAEGAGRADLYLLERGQEPVRLTRSGNGGGSSFAGALASACDLLVFVSDRDGDTEIYSMEPKPGAPARQLTDNGVSDDQPRWLRPCGKIVFVSERDGNPEIYAMNADGSAQTRLTDHGARDLWPAPAPDGTKIAFQTDRSGQFDLWIMNADGSDPRPFLESPASETEPVWSPDGQWIAFVSDRGGKPELHLLRADGSSPAPVRVLPARFAHAHPAWTADSASLVFSQFFEGASDIYSVPRSGGAAFRVTTATRSSLYPVAGQ